MSVAPRDSYPDIASAIARIRAVTSGTDIDYKAMAMIDPVDDLRMLLNDYDRLSNGSSKMGAELYTLIAKTINERDDLRSEVAALRSSAVAQKSNLVERVRKDFPEMVDALEGHIGVAQPPTKPWVCCNCDADLSCGACGVEQPNDSAYYEGIVKENERLKDRLGIAQRIIAEYQASMIAGAKADVAAHGLPGARAQGGPELSPEMLQAGAQALADDVWHPPQKFESLPPSDANRYRRQALLVLKAACSVTSTNRGASDE